MKFVMPDGTYFAILLEPHNRSIHVSELHEICRSGDFKAPTQRGKVRSGSLARLDIPAASYSPSLLALPTGARTIFIFNFGISSGGWRERNNFIP